MYRMFPLVLLAGGCLDSDKPRGGLNNVPVDTSKVPVAPTATAARVDQIGRQLVGSNPFLGFEPTFHTIGQPEPEVCHPDDKGVLVSAGLVDRCASDAELAAVLATELATMRAERQLLDRSRRAEPLTPPPAPGDADADLTRLGTQAVLDRKLGAPSRSPAAKAEDRRTVAADILKAAGYDPRALDDVAPLLVDAGKVQKAAGTFGGRGGLPRWSN